MKFSSILIITVFSLLGYGLLLVRTRKEQVARRRDFLLLTTAYATTFFLVMLPISYGGFTHFRYFNPALFIPFILLGLILEWSMLRFPIKYPFIFAIILISIAAANLSSLSTSTRALLTGSATSIDFNMGVLGEETAMTNYLLAHSDGQKEIALVGESTQLAVPIGYLAEKRGITIRDIRLENSRAFPSIQGPMFYIEKSNPKGRLPDPIRDRNIGDRKTFGTITLYELLP